MNQQLGKVVVVAVGASKGIPKTAIEWALTHVVEPGTCVKLLVLISPDQTSGKRLWKFQRLAVDCASGQKHPQKGTLMDQMDNITDSCFQLIHQLRDVHESCKINVRLKVLSGSTPGVVAAEAKRMQTSWVIMDKKLKKEVKPCMEQLQCNIVVLNQSKPKVLRLNLVGANDLDLQKPEPVTSPSSEVELLSAVSEDTFDLSDIIRVPNATPSSSPEHGASVTVTHSGTHSISRSDLGAISRFFLGAIKDYNKEFPYSSHKSEKFYASELDSDSDGESRSSSCSYLMKNTLPGCHNPLYYTARYSQDIKDDILLKNLSSFDECITKMSNSRLSVWSNSTVRDAIQLPGRFPAAEPPPLCSVCQHKAPRFGEPPKSFTYIELEIATDGFSKENFLAEGGFGFVYQGILPDGQVVAIKQHKLASSQGDVEFCSEVEVLSCAQHRNVVMLIGFCVEGGRRMLVYEYICNRSLDLHLYGRNGKSLEWPARQKVAVGSARGLRYLHEECRVGCIIHRDMRPNNILVTHDFEPMVGDFGLARCQPDGGSGEETRVLGTFGYLAPEYAQTGQITDKADVYSFGVVLLELVTGRKSVDINRPKGEQCLTEWARPLLEKQVVKEIVDPSLKNYSDLEVQNMLHCASLCIRRDPNSRPRVSQVLRLLEADDVSSECSSKSNM